MFEINNAERTPDFRGGGNRYRLVLAGLIPLVAFSLQWLFWSVIQPYVWFLFFPAVFFSSWVGGRRGGLLATALSTGLVWYFFIPPRFSFAVQEPSTLFAIGMFVSMGILFSYFHERLRQANRQAADARFRELFEQAAVGMTQVGLDGRFQRVNQRFCDILGYPREELLAKTFQDITHPDDLEAHVALVRQVLAGELQTFTLEKRYLRKDQSIVPINLTLSLVRDPSGKPEHFISVIEDITKRKQAQVAAAQLAAIVQSSDDAIIGKKLDGIVTSWNAGAEKVFGYAAGEMIGCSITRLIPPDHQGDEAMILAQINRGASVQHFETVRVKKDGGLIDVSVTVSPIKNAHGEVVGASKVARDITERSHAEQLVRESERFLQSTLDALSSHIAILDEQGAIIKVNAAWNRFASENGPNGNRYLGQNYLRVCDTATSDTANEAMAVAAGIRKVMAGQCAAFEVEYPCHSPQIQRWFLVRATRFAGAGPVRVVVAHENISARKQSEMKLRASEEKFALMFNSNPVATSLSTAREGRYLDLNRAWLKMFERSRDEAVGHTVSELNIWADPEQRDALFTRLQQNGMVENYEMRLRTKSGRILEILWSGMLLNYGGENCLLGSALDVTERRTLQKQLQQTQKLEAVGTLAGGIAHDFNNILGAIIAFTEMTKTDHPQDTELQENLDEVLNASLRAANLVKQILSFSRQQQLERRTLQLSTIVREALKLLRATLPATITLEPAIAANLPDVLADPTQMHQVMMNLCTNAAHAMRDQHGKLCVQLDQLHLPPEGPLPHPELLAGDYVRLVISDTGHGMEAAVLERIFEPFFTTKGPGEGTGLGLSVVHGIVKEHEGVIAVESHPGLGTTFSIYLPAQSVSNNREAVSSRQIPRGSRERILFVDDEPALGKVANRMLSQLGYQPVVFGDAAAAWQAIQENPAAYQLVITDLTMPVITGLELAKKIVNLRPDLPILLASGNPTALVPEELPALGIREVLAKPLGLELLAVAIHQVLRAPVPSK